MSGSAMMCHWEGQRNPIISEVVHVQIHAPTGFELERFRKDAQIAEDLGEQLVILLAPVDRGNIISLPRLCRHN